MIGNLDPLSLIAILGGLSLLPIVVLLTTSFLKISMVMILLRNAMGVQQVPPNIALYALSLILSAYVMAPVVKQITHDLSVPSAVTADAGSLANLAKSTDPAGLPGSTGSTGSEGSTGSSGPTESSGSPSRTDMMGLTRVGGSSSTNPTGIADRAAAQGSTGAVAALTSQPMTVSRLIFIVQRASVPMRDFMMRHSSVQERDFFVRTASTLWGPRQASGLAPDDFMVLVPAFLISQMTSAFKIGFLLYLPFVIIDLIVSNVLLAMGMMMVSPVTISMPLKLFLFVMVDGWTRLIHGLVLSYA